MVMEILVLIALVAGPYLGIWAQGRRDEKKQAKERKLDIFKTLMATRATPLSPEHVSALNRIDTEFGGSEEKKVRDAWNTLLDHFGSTPQPPPIPPAKATPAEKEKYEDENRTYQFSFAQWVDRVADLRIRAC